MLHEKLSARRRSIGMGIDQLVELSGIPKGTVTKVLTGVTKNPALETVKAIAYAMGMTLDDLAECDVTKTETLSEQASQFAAKYDTLDTPGKELIAAVMDTQLKRIDTYGHCKARKRIPILGTAYLDGRVETKYAARQEQKELAESGETEPATLEIPTSTQKNS